jgi:hypothetical protein
MSAADVVTSTDGLIMARASKIWAVRSRQGAGLRSFVAHLYSYVVIVITPVKDAGHLA